MNIDDIIKVDSLQKAEATYQPGWYVKLNSAGEYFWYRKDNDEVIRELRVSEALGYIWSPYHAIKEIRPENAGETWEHGGIKYFTVESSTEENTLHLIPYKESLCSLIIENVIHGKYNCKRLFPSVEEDGVERIEIEGVQWKEDCNLWIRPCGKNMRTKLQQLVGKPQMEMILKIPKEDKNEQA